MERPITEHQVPNGELLHDLSYAGGQLCPSPHLSRLVDGDDPSLEDGSDADAGA